MESTVPIPEQSKPALRIDDLFSLGGSVRVQDPAPIIERTRMERFERGISNLGARLWKLLELRAGGERITLSKFASSWCSYYYRKARVARSIRSDRTPCPACGIRMPHRIWWEANARTYDGRVGALIHTCARCGAKYADRPIYDAKRWAIKDHVYDEEQLPNHETLPPLEVVR